MKNKHFKQTFESGVLASTEVEDAVVEETTEVEAPAEPVIGVVVDCAKLNIRVAPNINADILCEVKMDTELMIELPESTDDWYKVCNSAGLDGFCMRKYVRIK